MTESTHPASPDQTAALGDVAWWRVTALALGIALVLLAYLPAILAFPAAEQWDAVLPLSLGFLLVALACGLAIYDVLVPHLGQRNAVGVGIAAASPFVLTVAPPFGPSDPAWLAYYLLAIGLVFAIKQRTQPAIIFGLLTTLPAPMWVFASRFLAGAGI